MSHVFRFVGAPHERAGFWRIPADEWTHIAKVLRLEVGAAVEVADGNGAWISGHLSSLSKAEISVQILQEHYQAATESKLALAVGALKANEFEEILPALVELGVDALHVFYQANTAKHRLHDKAMERWQRIIVASCKQCKRAWFPTMAVHASLGQFIAAIADDPSVRLVLDPGGTSNLLGVASEDRSKGVVAVVGGERGLDEQELKQLMAAGFVSVNLGPNVLRAVTAAIAATAVLAQRRLS